jgi:hypothetical protein
MGIIIETNIEFGKTYKDSISGFKGKVVAISKFQFGCIRIALMPPAKDGKLEEIQWFDEEAIEGLERKNRFMGGPTPNPKRNPDPK